MHGASGQVCLEAFRYAEVSQGWTVLFFLLLSVCTPQRGINKSWSRSLNTKPDHTTSQMYLMGFTEGQVKIQILLPGALIMALYHRHWSFYVLEW